MDKFRFTPPERRVFKAKERIRVSQWAERYREIVRGPKQGRWTNEATPYLVEPMDTFNLPWVRKIFLCFAPQTGKTSVAINCLMYAIDVDPGPAMYIMPDEKVAKRISRRQILPTFRGTPRVAELLSPRSDDVSTLHINFINGMDLMFAWASSAAALASESVRYLFFDEPGKYPDFSGREADPFSLAEVRANTYQYTSKEVYFSTPNVDGDAFDNLLRNEPDEVRRYNARCPFCGEMQIMDFERIHWQGKKDHRLVARKKLARYGCVKCGMDWDDTARNDAVKKGRWRAENPVERPISIAFGPLESWYSPFVSLSKAAAAFLRGLQDPKKLQAFVTQHQARAWKEVIESKQDSEILEHNNDIPPGIVPAWAVALTAGIDVQKKGFWFVVRAWAADLTSHLVQYGYLSFFQDVEALVFATRYQRQDSDETLPVWRAAMDTGGGDTDGELTRTEEIYEFVRNNGKGIIFGTKGSSRPQLTRVAPPKAIDKMPRSNKPIRGGLELRLVDTFELKKLLHWRLTRRGERTNQDGEKIPAETQCFHLHSETGLDYARQFLAEELRKDRKGRLRWSQIRRDNHLLDCEVLAAACAEHSWMPNLSMLARFQRQRDEKSDQKPKEQPATTIIQRRRQQQRPRPGGWMNM